MVANFLGLVDELLLKFSWRRLLSILALFLLVCGAAYGFEKYTAYFRMNRLGRAAAILSSLEELGESSYLNPDFPDNR